MGQGMLAIEDLACRRGGRVLFAGVDLTLRSGEAALVVGRNGAGKSSFLRVVAGLIPAFTGRIAWQGIPVEKEPEAFRAAFRYVGHADGLQTAQTVIENLAFWARLYGAAAGRPALEQALAAVGLEALADLPARMLSAGQRRRLALARPLASGGGRIWLLDEPTVALDQPSVARIEAAIGAFRAGGGIVIASTNAPLALPDATRLDIADHSPTAAAAA